MHTSATISHKRSWCSLLSGPSVWRGLPTPPAARLEPGYTPPGHPGCGDSTVSAPEGRIWGCELVLKAFLIPGLRNGLALGLIKAKRSEHPEP